MTTKLKWRLGKLPTPDEVVKLVNDKIITKEEAKEILFSQETEEERDKESLKAEIKFLRELVEKLSNRSQIIETIKYIEKPYTTWGWYKPYEVFCGGTNGTVYLASGNNSTTTGVVNAFSKIQNF